MDDSKFGPVIPHINGEVCPFPDAVGIVQFDDGAWATHPLLFEVYDWDERDEGSSITAYRLPADHHAYGPRAALGLSEEG
jgi:hypothetical protein